MNMDIGAASTAIGLINSTVQTAKTAIELAKHTKDADLRQSVSEVLDQILDLKAKVLELDDENRSLKQQIALRAGIERRGEFGYWFKHGESDPLCPKCYEETGKQIFLPPSEPWSGRVRRDCRVCHHTYWEKPMGQATVTVARTYDPYRGFL
jgi:hypothetical protein